MGRHKKKWWWSSKIDYETGEILRCDTCDYRMTVILPHLAPEDCPLCGGNMVAIAEIIRDPEGPDAYFEADLTTEEGNGNVRQ